MFSWCAGGCKNRGNFIMEIDMHVNMNRRGVEQTHEFKAYGKNWFITQAFTKFGLWRLRRHGAWDKAIGYNIYVYASKKDSRLVANIIPRWLFAFYWWAFFGIPSQRTIGMYLHMLELHYWERKELRINTGG